MNSRSSNKLYKMMHRGRLALLAGTAILAAAGCTYQASPGDAGGKEPAVKQTSAPEQTGQAGQAVQASQQAAFRYPLTGIGSEQDTQLRPVVVMVENAPQARPQSGLDQADIVYEILAEGEVTRFVAVYQSKSPKVIGPVRSIRPYFVEIGDGLDAMIVHAGWSQDAMNLIAERNLNHLDEVYGDGAYYWRSTERKAPHNLYTSMEKIRQGAVNKKFRTVWNRAQFAFASAAEGASSVSGQAASKVKIPYLHGYNVSYEYDAASGLYNRFMEGKPHTDKESGKQLTAANILVCESVHKVVDKEGRREVDVNGPGKGYLVQAGHVREVTWNRQDGVIRAFAGGKELPLLPGQTWVQFVPENWGVQTE